MRAIRNLWRAIGQNINGMRTTLLNHKEALGQFVLVAIIGLIIVTNVRLIHIITQVNERLVIIDARVQWLGDHLLPTRSDSPNPFVIDVTWEGAALRGSPDAPIKIVEFCDFQCPFCAASRAGLEQVFEQYKGQIMLAYRHFPLAGHPEAMLAAEASECAREQGKFWEMHNLIFENAQDLSDNSYRAFASELQLNLAQFDMCLSEHRYRDTILSDLRDGQSYGVGGTPTFFVNGRMLRGVADLEQFQEMIEPVLTSVEPDENQCPQSLEP